MSVRTPRFEHVVPRHVNGVATGLDGASRRAAELEGVETVQLQATSGKNKNQKENPTEFISKIHMFIIEF